jgi:glycosyltransferase involved in cell wall biosynthesis
LEHPERILWLTDTFGENNTISNQLKRFHEEIKRHNYPIDIMTCSNTVEQDDHLIVLQPLSTFRVPVQGKITIRVPNLIEIHKFFLNNAYDRIVCSTEGLMGLVSLYLKNAYSVKSYFYLHTDWILTVQRFMDIDRANLTRLKRWLRAFYKGFDEIIVLNPDHKKWLTGTKMDFESSRIHLSSNWSRREFKPQNVSKTEILQTANHDFVVLCPVPLKTGYGVLDIPETFHALKAQLPNLKMVFYGTGKAKKQLKKEIPEAIFLSKKKGTDLPGLYSVCDLMLVPTKSEIADTIFLEALSCGLPIVTYKTKVSKNFIEHGKNGWLVMEKKEMASYIANYLLLPETHQETRSYACKSASLFSPERVFENFFNIMGIQIQAPAPEKIHA